MNYYELDKDEQRLLKAIEKEKPVLAPKAKKLMEEVSRAARAAGNKTRNINIRLSERVVHRLKAKATREGIPYQTLAASILHKNT